MRKEINVENQPITKTDVSTGKKYFNNNIPVGALRALTLPNGKMLKIFAENGTDDVWYHGNFLGDRYAVFAWTGNFWQQVSNWYCRYGNATRYMCHKYGK